MKRFPQDCCSMQFSEEAVTLVIERDLTRMTKIVFFLFLGLLFFSHDVFPVFAEGYDACRDACNQTAAPCVEQLQHSPGNSQEEEGRIAACEKSKADCIQACKDTEAQPQSQPPAQEAPAQVQPAQVQPTQESTGVGTTNGIKTYEIKPYEFK